MFKGGESRTPGQAEGQQPLAIVIHWAEVVRETVGTALERSGFEVVTFKPKAADEDTLQPLVIRPRLVAVVGHTPSHLNTLGNATFMEADPAMAVLLQQHQVPTLVITAGELSREDVQGDPVYRKARGFYTGAVGLYTPPLVQRARQIVGI